MLGIHRNFPVLFNNKPKRKKVSNISSTRYKIDYGTKSSRSISILLGEFTGHCRSVPSNSLADCRDNYKLCVSGKSRKRSHKENVLKESSRPCASLVNVGTIPVAKY